MKKVTMYKCEICNEIYESGSEALNCESKGEEEPLANIGNIVDFYLDTGDADYDQFAANLRIYKITQEGHNCIYEFEEKDRNDEWVSTLYYKCNDNESFSKFYIIKG